MNYYVYMYKTPVELTVGKVLLHPGDPFYVGKGKEKRAWDHLKESGDKKINCLKHGVMDKIRMQKMDPVIEFVKTDLTEADAHILEINEIKKYGRISNGTGILTNLTDGGEGGSGFHHSDEQKLKWSEQRKGVAPANKGVKRPGVGGRPKGIKWTDEVRQKMEQIRSAPGFYNYTKLESRCKKISESTKGRKGAASGKTWFNNGVDELYAYECPTGYTKGRTKKQLDAKKGMHWYNNGSVNRQFKDDNVEEGFVRGRITKK